MEFIRDTKEKILHSPYFNKVTYLFDESFMTYSIGAYRSAYITSYVGFLQQIRQNIISYNDNPYLGIIEKKDETTEEEHENKVRKKWDSLKKDMLDDDKWENVLVNALKASPDTNILRLNDAERTKLIYFKDIRNDAVHDKTNEITLAQLHTLWEFIIEYAPRTRIGGDKDSFFKTYQEIAEWYKQSGDIPESKLRVIEEMFFLLTEKEKIEILSSFYDSFFNRTLEDIYTMHTREIYNYLFESHRTKIYDLVSTEPKLALFSIFVIDKFDVSCLQWDKGKSDSILRLKDCMVEKIIRFIELQDKLTINEKIVDFINVLSGPYKTDSTFPAVLKEILADFFKYLLGYESIELKELQELEFDEQISEMFRNIALESVENSYTYKGYYGKVTAIDTFSWNDIYINLHYIIYLSVLSLESEFAENKKIQEVFDRLKKLYEQNKSDDPNKNTSFLSNFEGLFEKIKDFPELITALEK